jgi:phosphatidylglycerophosphate synthase
VETYIFVPHPMTWRRGGTPGGLSLLERLLRQLAALGRARPTLLVPEGHPTPTFSAGGGVEVVRVAGGCDAFTALAAAAPTLPARFLLVTADHLIDSRVLRALATASDDVLVVADGGVAAPIGRVSRTAVVRHGSELPAHVRTLPLETLDAYAPELRGNVPPYAIPVRSAAERTHAWRVLLDHVQKRGLDLPGEYFDSPFENALVRLLAPTSVTPNQVTLATLVIAGVVGLMFLRGWLGLGLGCALLVGVLDGVDGKLARLKLATSRLGELEHVGDFLYENYWYVALAMHFQAASGLALFWHAGAALVALDLVDNLLYGAVSARTGRMLDELSPFDRRVRMVAGRRNVYVWMLLIGVCVRQPAWAFLVIVAWAAVTVVVHGARTVLWLGRGTRPAVGSQDLDTEPVTGALLNEK